MPPSTSITVPVTYFAIGEHRNTIMQAMSSGSPK